MIAILPIRAIDLRLPVSYAVAVYGARDGRAFTSWQSSALTYGRSIRLRLRIEKVICRAAIRLYSASTGPRSIAFGNDIARTLDTLRNAARKARLRTLTSMIFDGDGGLEPKGRNQTDIERPACRAVEGSPAGLSRNDFLSVGT